MSKIKLSFAFTLTALFCVMTFSTTYANVILPAKKSNIVEIAIEAAPSIEVVTGTPIITSPSNNTLCPARQPLTITATTPDPNGTLQTLMIIIGGKLVASTRSSNTITGTFIPPVRGMYQIHVAAYYSDGGVQTATPVNVWALNVP